MASPRFTLHVRPQAGRVYARRIALYLRRARPLIKAPLVELTVILVGDSAMSRLHEQFMKLAGPTDVMTFPMDVDGRGRALSGEVYVCVPEARRRVREQGGNVQDELLLYALHGMLHLCGYDDRTDRDFARMHAREDQILTKLGVGRVFARQSANAKQARTRQNPPPVLRGRAGRGLLTSCQTAAERGNR